MKELFCIIGLILSIEAYGQHSPCFFKQTNSPINIYESESGEIPFAVINQDSILENYYSVEILSSVLGDVLRAGCCVGFEIRHI